MSVLIWTTLLLCGIAADNSCYGQYIFELSSKSLMAEEGSCVELVCKLIGPVRVSDDSYWFWIKDAKWTDGVLNGIVVYSTNHHSRPLHSDFVNRVIASSQTITQNYLNPQEFKISICNLKPTDTGRYDFRFEGGQANKWITNPGLTLTVTENRCLMVFNAPPAVTESEMIHITCSASPSCGSDPKITDLTTNRDYNEPQTRNQYGKSIKINFTASWKDNENEFSCNSDPNPDLIKRIRIKVNYKPEVMVNLAVPTVVSGSDVMLECYVNRSNPKPYSYYSWVKDGTKLYNNTLKQYNIRSIMPRDGGSYTCQASNIVGSGTSKPFKLDVQYGPTKSIISSSGGTEVGLGGFLTFTCNTNANPVPGKYSWRRYTAEGWIDSRWKSKTTEQNWLFLDPIEKADEGCYTCNATNIINTGEESEKLCITVVYVKEVEISGNTAVKEGEALNVTCSIESFPPSLITWTKSSDKNMHNGNTGLAKCCKETSQQNDTDTVPQEELGMATFFISNVTAEDAGLYTCRVKYQNKTLMKTVDVTVIYMRNPVIAGNRTVTKGFPLSLTCSVQSFPSSRITWTKLGSDTKLHDQTDPGLENDTTSSVLVIPSMTLQHAGQYVCTAQHLDTTVTASADVTVTWFYKIQEESGCTVQSEVLTCVCLSEGFPLPAITWPILEEQAEYTVVTAVSNHTVNSTVTLVVKEHSNASVECVSSCGNEEAKEQLTVERTNGQQSTTQPELGFSMKSWLQLIIAFLAGILLALVIFSFAKKCSRNKHKGSGTLDGTVEMVISQEDPLINAGAAVEDDQTFYQEAAEEEKEEVNVAAKEASPDLNGSPRDVEYASIDFSALRRKNQREKATKPETTETEYAEVKREVKKDKEDDGEQGGDAYEGKEEEAMVREEEETKPEEEEEVYSTVRDIM